MVDEFPVIVIADLGREKSEPMGTKQKFWVTHDSRRWLFKFNRPEHGEDWSEKIAAEIARLLMLECAVVELAQCEGAIGVIAENFVDAKAGWLLVHGNELLNDYYGHDYPMERSYNVRQHCIPVVTEVLNKYTISAASPGSGPLQNLWHQFAGYLMFDALIGNSDRHHENWGIITPPVFPASTTPLTDVPPRVIPMLKLAPSFDHASSLGRELNDEARRDMLAGNSNRNVASYAARCRSKLYLDNNALKPLTPWEAFAEATAAAPPVRAFWLSRLAAVGREQFAAVIGRVPAARMSSTASRFALELLVYNRDRLLELD